MDKKVTEVLEEAKEKEQRKHNTIIANLPESMGVTVELRKRDRMKRTGSEIWSKN